MEILRPLKLFLWDCLENWEDSLKAVFTYCLSVFHVACTEVNIRWVLKSRRDILVNTLDFLHFLIPEKYLTSIFLTAWHGTTSIRGWLTDIYCHFLLNSLWRFRAGAFSERFHVLLHESEIIGTYSITLRTWKIKIWCSLLMFTKKYFSVRDYIESCFIFKIKAL